MERNVNVPAMFGARSRHEAVALMSGRVLSALFRAMAFSLIRLLTFKPTRWLRYRKSPKVFLGSAYGGKWLLDLPNLRGSILISGGAGEDISFEVEFIQRYRSLAVVVDPTPRSLKHFDEVRKRFGKGRQSLYTDDGAQPADSYDLTDLEPSQLSWVEAALWGESKRSLRLFYPTDPSHVSLSLRPSEPTNRGFLDAKTVSISDIISRIPSRLPSVVKLDIEGAELETLRGMFNCGIRPWQIVVEVEEAKSPSLGNFRRILSLSLLLAYHGYWSVVRRREDFTFVRERD